ncbi:MAG: hypothetical protein IPG71_03695 [bacterium]|nr:hypothetical protein [bacterium]
MEKRVKQLLDDAVDYAAGGEMPARNLIVEVSELPALRISKPEEAREHLWKILAHPLRGRALAVLNAVDLLIEIVPSWTAYTHAQDDRLAAVEAVHLEQWADGLSEWSFGRICRFHDGGVDGRLNGWALTSFATLLAYESDSLAGYLSSVRMDLTQLEATDGEIERIISILTEYPLVYAAILAGDVKSFAVSPGAMLAALASTMTNQELSKEQICAAIDAADRWLRR